MHRMTSPRCSPMLSGAKRCGQVSSIALTTPSSVRKNTTGLSSRVRPSGFPVTISEDQAARYQVLRRKDVVMMILTSILYMELHYLMHHILASLDGVVHGADAYSRGACH